MRRKLSRIQIGSTPIENYMTRYIVHECVGCNKVSSSICEAYPNPSAWFRNGKRCPLASHIETSVSPPLGKKRVGQQKQKKNR